MVTLGKKKRGPKMAGTEPIEHLQGFKATRELCDLIAEAAISCGVSRSAFIRRAIEKEVARVRGRHSPETSN